MNIKKCPKNRAHISIGELVWRYIYHHIIILPRDQPYTVDKWDRYIESIIKPIQTEYFYTIVRIYVGEPPKMPRPKFGNYSFVKFRPSHEELDMIKNSYDISRDYQDDIAALAHEGYKISISYNLEYSTFYFSVTGKDESGKNYLKVFTCRHDDLHKAIHTFFYAHTYLCQGDWAQLEANDASW
jgi:hypothetical protein